MSSGVIFVKSGIKGLIIPMGTNTKKPSEHLNEIHFVRGGVPAALAKASFSGLRSP